MGSMTTETTQTAVKPHVCSWCGERVKPGEEYKRYRYFEGGDAGTVKMHIECFDAMQIEVQEEGGWLEWSFGENERPVQTPPQDCGTPGTGECSCIKFGADPATCQRGP